MRKAFTMIELIFVIIVLGILMSASLNMFKRNIREEALNNIISSLRYTQHLALTDNKINTEDEKWQRSLWTIEYKKCGNDIFYQIGSDMNLNSTLEKSESAKSSIDKKYMFIDSSDCNGKDYSENINLSKKHEISSVNFSNCEVVKNKISFDYIGRPFKDIDTVEDTKLKNLLKKDCIITYGFSQSDVKDIKIRITKNTGYISIEGNNDL